MRKIVHLCSVVALLMVVMVAGIHAQEGTPPAGEGGFPGSIEIAPGVMADNAVFVEGSDAPINYRLTFEPGVVYEVMPSGNLELAYMEAGSLVVTLDAAVTIGRVGDIERGGLEIPANTEFTLGAGQFIVMQPGVSGEIRNEGTGPAVVSVAGLTPVEAGPPVASPMATPAG